jgi:predicted nucleic acid-binding protein
MIVVDTNIIGYLYLASERSPQAEQVLRRDAEWSAHCFGEVSYVMCLRYM